MYENLEIVVSRCLKHLPTDIYTSDGRNHYNQHSSLLGHQTEVQFTDPKWCNLPKSSFP